MTTLKIPKADGSEDRVQGDCEGRLNVLGRTNIHGHGIFHPQRGLDVSQVLCRIMFVFLLVHAATAYELLFLSVSPVI